MAVLRAFESNCYAFITGAGTAANGPDFIAGQSMPVTDRSLCLHVWLLRRLKIGILKRRNAYNFGRRLIRVLGRSTISAREDGF